MAVLTVNPIRTQRALEVENTLASVRLEGLEPSDEALLLFQRYVDGDCTSDELDAAFGSLIDRKYGPVRLPRDERS
jgi:hypothetical protein